MEPGARNAITDVPGLAVGSAEDAVVRTGVTVVLPDVRAVAAVDVQGGGTGTRELELLRPEGAVDAVDAVVLDRSGRVRLSLEGYATVALPGGVDEALRGPLQEAVT